jgi:hypothetical protein
MTAWKYDRIGSIIISCGQTDEHGNISEYYLHMLNSYNIKDILRSTAQGQCRNLLQEFYNF